MASCFNLVLRAPHRLCFMAGATLGMLAAVAWLIGVWADGRPAPAMQLWWPSLHALVFSLGPLPLFIAGFLFTAGARWLRVPAVDARSIAPAVLTVLAGWLVVMGAAGWGLDGVAAGLLLCAVGWCALCVRLWRLRTDARARDPSVDRLHFEGAWAACVALTACLLGAAAAARWAPEWLRTWAAAGLWWGVVTVFVTVSHRMLPFLGPVQEPSGARGLRSSKVRLALLVSAAVVGGVAAWLPPGRSRGLDLALGLHALAVAIVSARWFLDWWDHPARRTGLFRLLHRAFGWWVLAWFGWAAARGAAVFEPEGPSSAWAVAALHALAMGYLGGTWLAMASRVSATQAGRATAIDRTARVFDAALQGAVVARVGAALVPAASWPLLGLAALAWAALVSAWLGRHASDWLRP